MKCTKLADWLDEHGEELAHPAWQDLLAHSRFCPDCSLFLKNRSVVLTTMREAPPPQPPIELKAHILAAIEWTAPGATPAPEVDSPEPGESWIDSWLTPLQVAAVAGCVLLTVSFAVRTMQSSRLSPEEKLRVAVAQPKVRPTPVSRPVVESGEKMARLSDTEVADFLKRLEEYRRLHPEMEGRPQPVVESELVNFPAHPSFRK
jgi:hypothetical protein